MSLFHCNNLPISRLRVGLIQALGLMSKQRSGRIAFGVIPLWLIVSVPLAFLAFFASPFIPRLLGLYVFFAPQYLFSFSHVVAATRSGYEPLFAPGASIFFNVALWLLVTIGYGRIARQWPVGRTIWLGLAVVLAVTLLVHLGFSAFGYRVQLDGP